MVAEENYIMANKNNPIAQVSPPPKTATKRSDMR